MAEPNVADKRTIRLDNIILSFTDSLYEKAKTAEDAIPKYNFNVIVPTGEKHSEANLAKIQAAVKAAGEQKWGNPDIHKVISEKNPMRVCFRKGERFSNAEGQVYEGYAGNWGISCGCPGKGQKRPKPLLDRHKREVEEKDIPDVFYSGTRGDVFLEFYGTEKGGNGIFCTAASVRSLQEGERIGGGGIKVSADMFEDAPEGDAFEGTTTKPAAGGADDFD